MLYRLLLWLYPASWRAEYGEEMRRDFARRRRDGGPLVWLEVVPDVVGNAVAVQWDVTRQDLRQALRGMRRSPGFAAAAVAIAALGIGATTAAFALVDHVLLRPLNYPEPDRLVKLRETLGKSGGWNETSPANYRDWKSMSRSFESMGAYTVLSLNLSGGDAEPERVDAAALTAEVLPLLGVQPLLGRVFSAEDDREGAARTMVLSYGLWQQEFGGDSAILGRTVRLDDETCRIVAVMPRGFYFPDRDARLWVAMRFPGSVFENRRNTFVFGIGRLKPGVSFEAAQAEMRGIGEQMARAYPKELAQVGVSTVLIGHDISGGTRVALKMLLGAGLCVLLIACTNIANLMLARAMSRRRELAVRTALGAGRERLVRQMLTETLLVAAAGGALGVLLARTALPAFAQLVPESLPMAGAPAVDGRLLVFAALLTLGTAIGFGVAPALRAASDTSEGLREGGRAGVGGRRERLRSALVVAQIACSVVLLVGFGLLARALWRVQAVDTGFRADHAITLRTQLPMPRYDTPEAREPFYRRVLEDARRLPGVTAAAYTSFLPIAMGGGIWPVEIEGRPEDIARRRTVSIRFVTPGYFTAMGIPLLSGRDIEARDTHTAPVVAIVSRSFVDRYWPGENPIGRRFDVGNQVRTIVGVAGDVRVRGPERSSEPQVYLSWQQTDGVAPWYAPKDLVVRTSGDASALAGPLRRIVHAADAGQPVSNVRLLADIVENATATRRTQLTVLGAFGGVALLLAGLGIHGLLAFAVSSRTQEIGLRMALGAGRSEILGMTVGGALRLAAVGIVAGAAGAAAVGQWLQSLLAGVSPWDPAAGAAAVGLALAMAVGGSLLPALRALRVDPASAMRAE
jgi:predicted permease